MSLLHWTLKGAAWRGMSLLVQFILGLIFTLIMMRLIEPRYYASLARIAIVAGFVGIILDLGLSQALVQTEKLSSLKKHTHFWAGVILGAFWGLLLYVLSPFIAEWMEDDTIILPLQWIAISTIFGSSILVHRSLMVRSLQFKELGVIQIFTFIVSGVISIIMATKGWKLGALVIQLISLNILQTLGFWLVSSYRPKFQFQRNTLKETRQFSVYSLGLELIDFVYRLSDQIFGLFRMDAVNLGNINRANALIRTPLRLVPNTVNSVALGAFSEINRTEKERGQGERYLRIHRLIILLFYPLLLMGIVLLPELIPVLIGESWLSIIPLLVWVLLSGFIYIISFEGSLLMAQGEIKSFFYLSLIKKTIVVSIVIIVLFYFTMENVAKNVLIGIFIGECVGKIISLWWSIRFIKFRILRLLKESLLSILYACIPFIIFLLVDNFFNNVYLLLLLALLLYIGYIISLIIQKENNLFSDVNLIYKFLISGV